MAYSMWGDSKANHVHFIQGDWSLAQVDDQLRQLVDKHGPKRWSVIAKELKVKSSKQCRRRWKNVLNATRKTGAPCLDAMSLHSEIVSLLHTHAIADAGCCLLQGLGRKRRTRCGI